MSDAFITPPTAKACRERLLVLADEMASIRTQIATADIHRQHQHRALDPQWFHQVKTALRIRQMESAHLNAHLAAQPNSIGARAGREGFKDALIEVVRGHCDASTWAQLLTQARELHQGREALHG